jgi:hypothetical protein
LVATASPSRTPLPAAAAHRPERTHHPPTASAPSASAPASGSSSAYRVGRLSSGREPAGIASGKASVPGSDHQSTAASGPAPGAAARDSHSHSSRPPASAAAAAGRRAAVSVGPNAAWAAPMSSLPNGGCCGFSRKSPRQYARPAAAYTRSSTCQAGVPSRQNDMTVP